MYAGTTFNKKSGRVMGVHQRIDRVARRSLAPYLPHGQFFPDIRPILHFEGKNGPDGIKSKRPGVDEPWHFIDPKSPADSPLLTMIDDHIYNLAEALRIDNKERAAFEAAWLAHAVTDGLTPAHHYPLEEKLGQLRGGEGLETRNTKRAKVIMPGKTKRHQLANNWEMWGKGGVMTSHFGFEWGVMTVLGSSRMERIVLRDDMKKLADEQGYRACFLTALDAIDHLAMYDEYMEKAWTRRLAKRSREILIPTIIELVTLAWLEAVKQGRAT